MTKGSIFSAEEKVISGIKALLSSEDAGEPELRRGLENLLTAYQRLHKEEKKLIRVNDRQQNQMNRLNRELKTARDTAEAASRSKGEFLANMSHEIRTPMNAVIGLTELTLRTRLTSQQHDYLTKIESSANSLLGIINDILDFSKIEVGKLELEHIDFQLNEVLENLTNLIAVKAEEKGLELLFNVDPEVPAALKGDPLRLGQILINLTSNAVKFTEKGEILVQIEPLESRQPESGSVVLKFSVQDTGIGLSDDQKEGLFQSFSQADQSTTRKYGGTGLGLNISKQLSEMMGGTIGVESEPEKGSTFWFTAEFGRQAAGDEPCTRLIKSAEGLKVLVVDDNPKSREILDRMLAPHAQVVQAASANEAFSDLLEADRETPFDLVLMDWKMPGMDGVDAITRIRTGLGLSRQPVVFLVTAYGLDEVRRMAREAGFDGFLIKPVTASLLFTKINSVFETSLETKSDRIRPEYCRIPETVKGARILVVEDNEINRQVAEELLTQSGFSVSMAVSGKEAVKMVQHRKFDLVFMDVQMPEMDGYQTTRAIRELEEKSALPESPELSPFTVFPVPQLPIVAMTANALVGDREKCLEAGMNDYMTKPVTTGGLSKIIQAWVLPGERQKTCKHLPEKDTGLPEQIQGLDIRAGLNSVGNNRALYKKIIIKFYHHNKDTLSSIKTAVENEDFQGAAFGAHTLKGVASNIGANEVYRSAAALEKALTGNKPGQAHLFLEQLCLNLGEVLDALAPLVKEAAKEAEAQTLPAQKMTGEAREEIEALLQRLALLLREDIAEANQTLVQLSGILGRAPEMNPMKSAFDEYDWEGVLKQIRHLAARLDLKVDVEE